ncbi:hypothetical protein KR059_000411, partial [Drosophila kikkawai]
INTCEMYPRRRATEFYRTPRPRTSIQSTLAEHPRDKLIPHIQQRYPSPQFPRILPPRTPSTANMRNSYFS